LILSPWLFWVDSETRPPFFVMLRHPDLDQLSGWRPATPLRTPPNPFPFPTALPFLAALPRLSLELCQWHRYLSGLTSHAPRAYRWKMDLRKCVRAPFLSQSPLGFSNPSRTLCFAWLGMSLPTASETPYLIAMRPPLDVPYLFFYEGVRPIGTVHS